MTRRQTAMIRQTVVAAKNVAKKASVQANKHVLRAKKAVSMAKKSLSAAKRTASVAKKAASVAVAVASATPSPARKSSSRRKVLRRRRYTMRMAKAMVYSPAGTPMRARRHKHLDKYKRRIFIGPRGGKFALRPAGSRVYHVQEGGVRYPLYGVYKRTSSGAVKMLKKFLGVFTTKRRMLKKK